MGQRLFILCINDIYNISLDVKHLLFADGTSIFCSNNNEKNM